MTEGSGGSYEITDEYRGGLVGAARLDTVPGLSESTTEYLSPVVVTRGVQPPATERGPVQPAANKLLTLLAQIDKTIEETEGN